MNDTKAREALRRLTRLIHRSWFEVPVVKLRPLVTRLESALYAPPRRRRRRKVGKATLMVLACLAASHASAQPLPGDRLVSAWPVGGQRMAEVLSTGTVVAAVVADTVSSWRASERREAFMWQAGRTGAVLGSTWLVKRLLPRQRPCAPACGHEQPRASFWSGHTALAFSGLGGARVAITVPLGAGTGYLRIAANKHYLTDVLVGAAVGVAAGIVVR